MKAVPNLKSKPFGGAWSIHDNVCAEYIDEMIKEFPSNLINRNYAKHEFFDTYMDWLPKYHNLSGFEKYGEYCFTNGTTESFVNFYLRYRGVKRLRVAKGDYFYHQMTQRLFFNERGKFAWLEDSPLKSGDLLVISCPFSDTGDLYPDLEAILNRCDQLYIPVMLDLAYINISENMTINLEHDCIEYIVSSLSKTFPLEHHRIGIRLQKTKFEDPLYVINEDDYNYLNMMSIFLGSKLMQEFPSNYITQKYLDAQDYWCDKLDVTPSPCVIFGIDKKNKYPEYNRGVENSNRLCFSRIWDERIQLND
jgi:hypothetical protein